MICRIDFTCIMECFDFFPSNSISSTVSVTVYIPLGAMYVTIPLALGISIICCLISVFSGTEPNVSPPEKEK